MFIHETSTTENETKQLTKDEAFTQVSGAGFYQKRGFLIFGLQWVITNQIFLPVFFFVDPSVDCHDDKSCLVQCTSNTLDGKYLEQKCEDSSRRQYVFGESLTTAFNALLPCNKTLQSIIKSIVYFGSLTGFFVFSLIADNYGRKLTTLRWIKFSFCIKLFNDCNWYIFIRIWRQPIHYCTLLIYQ